MFIKFGDKTKPLNVKNSKNKNDKENTIYLNDEDENNIRVKILKDAEKKQKNKRSRE